MNLINFKNQKEKSLSTLDHMFIEQCSRLFLIFENKISYEALVTALEKIDEVSVDNQRNVDFSSLRNKIL